MRKMILMAIAGYLWKKYKARDTHAAHTATSSGPAATATARPSTPA